MSEHSATVQWQRRQAMFIDSHYSREHTWQFDGGAEIAASASPQVVPMPYSNAACVDPEEAFVASLASCHMLWFLAIAAKKKFVVDTYCDRALGKMAKDPSGRLAIVQVCLRPQITFTGDSLPSPEQIAQMHKAAHHSCFLANSVKSKIIINAVF
ncbi:MAG: OsmC family peroxiredoxin [Leptolyngbyaceae cyanobacterium SL_1_1]|nr:OsmC family peroxiredoxin [Leptolyngbyaceae cyanobacterium RM1_1_2]NJO11714.1 OsmC family peroxiredoxin [Leptolyngbyaceae cyanobacterium SL_1_1]